MCGLWVDYGKRQGVICKTRISLINQIILVLNNRWIRSMACGPCPAMVHGGPAMDGGTELAGAWPPAALVSKGAGQGAGEGEWNTGNSMVHSLELGR
jgi:hypothetical protein